jgi:hypothetical protein
LCSYSYLCPYIVYIYFKSYIYAVWQHSQTRRIVMGLEKFKHEFLDFRNLLTLDQGFVEEVFHVFQNNYPQIKIEHTKSNDDLQFMIDRSLPSPE